MSRSIVGRAKESMDFRKKGPSCGNCRWFSSEIRVDHGLLRDYEEEVKKQCTFLAEEGVAFAVGKSNWCQHYEPKD